MTDNPATLAFEGVSVSYAGPQGRIDALDSIDLSLGKGEFVAVIGPSGCGKTSLLKLAAGLMAPSQGRVLVDGRPVRGPGPERGVIFQDYGVFPWASVEDNIAFGLGLTANRALAPRRQALVDHYIALMGLADFRHAAPHTLSGGMKQRTALARALVVNPRVLLMDEPFAALDAQTRLIMQDLMLDIMAREHTTGLLITHAVEEALYLAARVVVVTARPGRVKAVVEVPFAYPRDHALLASPEFARLKGEVTRMVMDEYALQARESLAPLAPLSGSPLAPLSKAPPPSAHPNHLPELSR